MDVAATRNSTIAINLIRSMRPKQWIKNLFVLAPLIFSKTLFVYPMNVKAFMAFAIFCAVSGCIYLINDIADREEDQRHPVKRLRPIASGALSPYFAAAVAGQPFLLSFL